MKVKFTLVQAMKDQRGSSGTATSFLNLGTTRGGEVKVNAIPWLLYTQEGHPISTIQEAEWAPGLVWTGAKNLAPTAIQSPFCPARSKSLH